MPFQDQNAAALAAGGGSTADEKAPAGKKAKYLGNHTITTEAGHKIEIDNSPGDRRFHVYHASGTFIEIQDNGMRISKVQADDQEYVNGNKDHSVHGNFNLIIDGNYTINVTGKLKMEVGDFELVSHKDINFKSAGNTLQEHGGDQKVQVNGASAHRTSGNRDVITGGSSTTNIMGSETNFTMGDVSMSAGGDKADIAGGTATLIGGSGLDLGSGAAMGVAAVGDITVKSNAHINLN